MKDLNDLIRQNQEVAKVLDELLKSSDWNTSLFLKVAGKQLYKLRSEAEALVEEGEALIQKNGSSSIYKKPPLKKDEVELFIALYQSQGMRIDKWEETLRTLGASSIGRPIYKEKSQVEKTIDSRGNPLQEGYAVVYVKQGDIIEVNKSRETYDRFGHLLLNLTEQAVKIENIHEFIHANQKHYRFYEGQLSLIE